MKSRSREINIFSMSALDLFASALGAFILISVVLMPYFLRVSEEEVEQLRRALTQAQAALNETQRQLQQARSALQQCQQREAACRQELDGLRQEVDRLRGDLERTQGERDQAQRELRQCRADLNACEERLSKTFLAVVIQWPTSNHDVDLHIIDAAGREFYYSVKTIPGRPGELSADTQRGPGVEIWEVPIAPPGEYQVFYNFYAAHGNSNAALVKGGVYHRDGHYQFNDRRLTRIGRAGARLVAVITVNNDGGVEIDER